LKLNQKKINFFLERKILLHGFNAPFGAKKILKNGEEIELDKKNFTSRKAKITYTFDSLDPFCKLKITLDLVALDGQKDSSMAYIVVKPKK